MMMRKVKKRAAAAELWRTQIEGENDLEVNS